MGTRFVVFAAPRTGSNWLCSLLDSHPEILCHHELFNPKKIIYSVSWHGRETGLGTPAERDADPLGFLGRLWSLEVPEQIVGFKWNLGQEPRIFDAVAADRDVRKLLLVRGNRLRTYVSEAIAQTLGQWESYPWSKFRRNALQIEVDPEALRRHVERNERHYETIRSRVRGSGQPLLELTYEKLAEVGEQSRALEFLGAAPTATGLTGATERQNPAPLDRLISNFDDLAAALRGSDLERDVREEADP
jgi:LPS sulfotransferase NodH